MAHSSIDVGSDDVWIIDSGCSNHMYGRRSLFKELDESEKSEFRLGNEKAMTVDGKGTIALKTSHGRRNMVLGLPRIDALEFCEGCVYEKQNRNSFPVGNWYSQRAHNTIYSGAKWCCRKNQTVVERGRSMMQARGVPKYFWAEAVATALYMLNISPTKVVLNQTPYEAWRGNKPKVSHLHVFGRIVYSLVNSQARYKLDEKSKICIFVGYNTQSKAYKLYNPLSEKIVINRNVMLNEDARWNFDFENVISNIKLPPTDEAFEQEPVEVSVPGNASSSSSTSSSRATHQSRTSAPAIDHGLTPKEVAAFLLQMILSMRPHQRNSDR
ncbi:hypothetical protein KY284_036183 [Solanum tuberosum]|nr:hypothetical protein KY284_036183 [Solanum tuberosum]